MAQFRISQGNNNQLVGKSNPTKLLERTPFENNFQNSDSASNNINTDRLLNENMRLAYEEAVQKYKTKKRSILLAYLLFIFTFTIIPNFYVGRKRWAHIQLIGLVTIIILLIVLTILDLPPSFYPFADKSLLSLILGVWLFDFFTLWYAVLKFNSRLYESIFGKFSQASGAYRGTTFPASPVSTMPSATHESGTLIKSLSKTSSTLNKRSLI